MPLEIIFEHMEPIIETKYSGELYPIIQTIALSLMPRAWSPFEKRTISSK